MARDLTLLSLCFTQEMQHYYSMSKNELGTAAGPHGFGSKTLDSCCLILCDLSPYFFQYTTADLATMVAVEFQKVLSQARA